MSLFDAMVWARRGYSIRRAPWVEDVETPVAGSTNKRATAWVTHLDGVWYYRLTDGTTARIVEGPDVDLADHQATDWTVRTGEWMQPPLPPEPPLVPPGGGGLPPLPPLPVEVPAGAGGGGGSGGGSGSGSGTGGGGDGSGAAGGGGGGTGAGGSAGSGRSGRGAKPDRDPPSVTLAVLNTSAEFCYADLGPEFGDANDNNPHTDSFSYEVDVGADASARPGEVWFLNIGHGSPTGWKSLLNGTIAPGGNQAGTFNITALPYQKFTVSARIHLAGVGLNNSDSKMAKMRGHCAEVPHILNFQCEADVGVSFTRLANDPDTEWVITPLFEGSATGLTYAWSGDLGTATTPTFTVANTGTPGEWDVLLTLTNDFGEHAVSFHFSLQDPP